MTNEPLRASDVLVTVGTLCGVSSVGSSETHRALVTGSPYLIGHVAYDAGLVDFDPVAGTIEDPVFVRARGERIGEPIALEEIESEHGDRLRSQMGIRALAAERLLDHAPSDLAAPLPHDLENGGLRRTAGLTFADVRASGLADMFGLFDDDPRLGPSLQSQLFLYGAIGALAALPEPLATLVPDPSRFRVGASCAFPGFDSHAAMAFDLQPNRADSDGTTDKLAYRLAASLGTHGPGLVSTVLSPGLSLSRVRRKPEMLEALVQPDTPRRRVPQAPMVTNGACASALIGFADFAAQMVSRYPGLVSPEMVLWTAADAALEPDARILQGFGAPALMSSEKLERLNEGRSGAERRTLAECLAPFDVDAHGTVVGHAGSGILVTNLEFALRNDLDVTSILVGWGQSAETGAKAHFAGVGFGGENALIGALEMARAAHGYGLGDFHHVVAHATGTRTNSQTELATLDAARTAVAAAEGWTGSLPRMTIGAHKAIGDGHTMGETGLRAMGEAIQYVLGHPTLGVPSLRRLDPDLGAAAEHVSIGADPVPGNRDGGVLVPTQGFGGFDGAVAVRAANPESLGRYRIEPRLLERYLERWPEIRRQRVERETGLRRQRGFVLELADRHRWHGAD